MNEVLADLPPVWVISIALVLALLVAWLFGSIARWLLRGRAKLGTATSIVISILGSAIGLLVAGAFDHSLQLLSWPSVVFTLGFSIGGIALYAAIAAHFQAHPALPIQQVLRAGESERVEFKSTARVNLHTGQRDDKMEQVIAKTACAFFNADGGTLVIGVDDTGAPLGLDADLATMKAPDLDRYELWLRDLLTATMGQNAAALAHVEFPEVVGADEVATVVCVVNCQPSPRPVYLEPGKAAVPEFWLRSGNSTRHLLVDEATEYVMHRWPLNFGSSMAAQLRAAVRFSEGR
jgi:uncharacterized membrane protein YeaQ/YmgE (transglycosylase-associated protein family)